MPPTKGASIADKRADKVAGKGKKGRKKQDSDEEAYVGTKSAKDKKERDPDQPKKPQSSYFHFMNTKRGPVKEAEPNLKFGELTKRLTEMWRALDETEKKIYEDLAAKDKERYHGEMEAKGCAVKKKVVPEEGAPKKGLSSFFLYSADARERIKKSNPDIKQPDILKKIGAEWKGISDEERAKWEEKSR